MAQAKIGIHMNMVTIDTGKVKFRQDRRPTSKIEETRSYVNKKAEQRGYRKEQWENRTKVERHEKRVIHASS